MDIWIAGSTNEVLDAAETGLVSAIVTNPTVIASWTKDGDSLEEVIAHVTSRTDLPLYVQLYGPDKQSFLEESAYLRSISSTVRPKLPATIDGIAATKEIAAKGIETLVTTIGSIEQAYAAAVAGASAICPYVARLNDHDNSAGSLLKSIHDMYVHHNIGTKVIPASVRTSDDIRLCLSNGCHGVIVFYDLFRSMFDHPVMKESLDGFEKNWKSINYSFRINKK